MLGGVVRYPIKRNVIEEGDFCFRVTNNREERKVS